MDNKSDITSLRTYPKIIIIGEGPVSENLGGSAQTIYNLFRYYPAEKILSITSDYNKNAYKKNSYIKNIIFAKTTFIPYLKNRFGFLVNKFIHKTNYKLRSLFPIDNIKKILNFNADIVLICPNVQIHLLYGLKVINKLKLPFIIYYMDDWMNEVEKQKFYNTNALAIESLRNAVSWLMISKELQKTLAERFGIENKKFLIVQNPVEIDSKQKFTGISLHNDIFQIMYAGSIWDMHYDALEKFANAIKSLRDENHQVELIIFTFEHFWEKYKHELTKLEVKYGGALEYAQVNEKLRKGDLHLVTSSFTEVWKAHSLASVQTKITDYMASGRPVISYGPEYSACHRFIKEWQAGYICFESDILNLKNIIISIINDKEKQNIGKRNLETITNHFSANVVCPALYNFIANSLEKKKHD